MGENLQTKVGSQITLGNSLPILCPIFMQSFCQSRFLLLGELPGLNVGVLPKPEIVKRAPGGGAKSHFVCATTAAVKTFCSDRFHRGHSHSPTFSESLGSFLPQTGQYLNIHTTVFPSCVHMENGSFDSTEPLHSMHPWLFCGSADSPLLFFSQNIFEKLILPPPPSQSR